MNKTEVKIPEILFFQEGPGVRNTQYTSSGVKLLNVANLVDGKVDLSTSYRYISEDEAYGKYRHFLCDEGDFIVASSGIKVDYIDKKMGFISREMLPLCMNTSTIRFKVLDGSKLNIKYFMYFLKSTAFKKQLAKQITGSAQLNYGPSHLKQMTFPLIDIKIQNDLVQKLDSIMRIIDQKNASLKKLDELVKARFVEMFENDNMDEKTIEDVASFCSRGRSPKYVTKSKLKVINQACIYWDRFKFENVKYNEEDYDGDRIISNNDLLICSTGTGTLGRCNIFRAPDDSRYMTDSHVTIIRLNGHILPEVFKAWFERPRTQEKLYSDCVSGSTNQIELSKEKLKNMNILVPPINLQKQFASFVKRVDKSKFALVKSIKLLKKLPFDMLLGLL